jgi:hypothetical protein
VIDSRRIAALWFATSVPPPAPVATAASAIQPTSFSANWNASAGADGYLLDVATDSGFTSFVTDYQDLDVGDVLTYSVTHWSISPGTTYYYRVRAYNGNGTSGDSNTISVTTLDALMLGNHTLWQVTNRFTTTSPVADVFFRFNLSRGGAVTVDILRVNFTIAGGVANADVTAGALYVDLNNDGVLDGGDTLIQGSITPVAGVLTFTTDFIPATSGTNYLVRATVANLVVGDTATFSVAAADIDVLPGGLTKLYSISPATHTRVSVSSLYRSVGTNGADLNSGGPTVTISGTAATFSGAMPNNVGVGDVLQYNSGGLRVAVIHGRTSSAIYTVADKNGGTPTAAPALTAVAVYRAYTSLANWQSQTQNANITADTINPNKNLVSANAIMNVACYVGSGADTTAVTITGWTTGAGNYIKIYTPYLPSEVGVTQRHNGKWDDSKYRIQASNTQVIYITGAGNVWIDGLQINLSSGTGNGQHAINISHAGIAANHRISNNIIKFTTAFSASIYGIGLVNGAASSVVRIWNNIIYGFSATSNAGIYNDSSANTTVYAYNNTVYGCYRGYLQNSTSPFVAKNNIAYSNSDNWVAFAAFDAASRNNLSGPGSDADIPPTGARNGVPVTFIDPTGSPPDLHLASSDTGAKDYGFTLSSDANLAFSDDIEGHSRPYGSAWDIGADEYMTGLFGYRRQITVGNAMTPASCGSDLSDFPIVVSITSDASLKTVASGGHVAHAQGYDIIFRALDGKTQLDHEIESYDGSTGTLVAWVRIPTLVYNSDTPIYMYYGNAGITGPTANPAGVWGTSYKGVWHLTESGNGTAAEYNDSSQYANDGQGGRGNSSYVPKQTAAGQIGFGQQFDNLVDGKYDLVDAGNGSALNITGNQITLEAWVRHDLSAPYAHESWGLVNRKGWSNGYRLLMQTSGYGCAPLCVHFGLGEGSNFLGTATLLTAGSWHHVVGTYDGSLMKVFIDGVQDANTLSKTAALTAPPPPEDHVWIGYGDQPTDVGWSSEWVGQIDEVRISNVGRSDCWIGTEYNSVQYATNSSYIAVGAEGAAGPTVVDLVSLDATAYPGRGVLVSWRTGFEVDNLGFHVYRDAGGERVPITPSLIAGSALFAGAGTALTAGRSYLWWDPAPVAGASYWLEEWELSGEKRWHGPVTVQPGVVSVQAQALTAASSPLLAGMGQAVSPSPPQGVRRRLRQGVGSGPDRLSVQWGLASRPAVKLLVSEQGWYRVSQEELVRAGLDPGVDPGRLQLFADGVQVPILMGVRQQGVFASGDGIEFYGEGLDTRATAVRVYWLVVGSGVGLRIPEAVGGGQWAPGPGSFPSEVERADRTLYFPALLNGEEGNFFGAVVTSTPVVQVVRVQHVDQAGQGELVVRLQGGTAGAHRVGVELNGTRVGTVIWDGLLVGELVVPVGPGMIAEGDNRVVLTAEGGEGDASAVESIRIRYAHTWQADGEALEFSLGGYQEVTIGGFRSSQVRVVDITDPGAVQVLPVEVVEEGGGYQATVGVPESGTRTLLAVGTGAIRHPVGVLANRPSAWHAAGEGADLLIIAHRSLLSAVEPLRSLRESQGLKVAVVDVEDVYDEFSFGAKDPQAIKDLLACAINTWSRPPRYLLLVGDASYDPMSYLGYGYLDLVPTRLVDTTYLETASDDWFADFDADGIADIPVGRIPVQTLWEATTVVGKIVAYDGSAKLGRVLLVADANDEDNDFEALSGSIKAVLPSTVWAVEVYRGQLGDGAAKLQLMNGIDLGQTLINYVGHGSVGIWHDNLLTSGEARALGNDRFGLVVSMTCLNGFFQDPFDVSLAEAFLQAPAGGAVAVWASSGLTESASQGLIDEALVRLLFSGTSTTLGDATLAAKTATTDLDVRRTWILFGDPTTRLRR